MDGRKVNRRVVESLVKCGAFESLHDNRAAVWGSGSTPPSSAARRPSATARSARRTCSAVSTPGRRGSGGGPALADAPAWTDRERLAYEKELLGFYVTGHPLADVAPELARYTDVRAGLVRGP